MIRPSALQIAEKCGLAPRLAEQYPETTEAANAGTAVHEEIARVIRRGGETTRQMAAAAVRWFALLGPVDVLACDDTTMQVAQDGSLVTEGTPDLVYRDHSGAVVVVDWKTGRRGRVTQVSDNLQLAAYAIAADRIWGKGEPPKAAIVFLESGTAVVDGPAVVDVDRMLPRVLAAAAAEPVARVGTHCQGCYQSGHCPSYLLPAHEGETALAPFTVPGGLAGRELEAIRVLDAIKVALKKAEGAMKNHVALHGPIRDGAMEWGPREVAGRRQSPSVAELEAAGLGHLVRPGEPYTRYEWRRVK